MRILIGMAVAAAVALTVPARADIIGAALPAYLHTPEQSLQNTEPNALFIRGPYAVRLPRCQE